MKDHKIATLVGKNPYVRAWCKQFILPGGAALLLLRPYYTPNDVDINEVGIILIMW